MKPYTPLSKLPGFDPLKVPVLAIDGHLPAIQVKRLEAASLQQRFSFPPAWQPEIVEEPRFLQRPICAAAVLLAIVQREHPTVLLTQRTAHLSNHSGQIAFPGGKVDDSDASVESAALREAQEEVGLAPAFVRVLGRLPQYTTGTAFAITPVVALVDPGFSLMANPNEVADIFEVPLAFLMNPVNHRRHAFEFEGHHRQWFSMPYDDATPSGLKNRFIWGATAGILRNFYRFLHAD